MGKASQKFAIMHGTAYGNGMPKMRAQRYMLVAWKERFDRRRRRNSRQTMKAAIFQPSPSLRSVTNISTACRR